MRYIGSNLITRGDKRYIRIRNRGLAALEITQNLLDFLGDLRYVELFADRTWHLHVQKPAGTKIPLPPPYRVVEETNRGIDNHDITQ